MKKCAPLACRCLHYRASPRQGIFNVQFLKHQSHNSGGYKLVFSKASEHWDLLECMTGHWRNSRWNDKELICGLCFSPLIILYRRSQQWSDSTMQFASPQFQSDLFMFYKTFENLHWGRFWMGKLLIECDRIGKVMSIKNKNSFFI